MRKLVLLSLFLVLSACGGGGDGSPASADAATGAAQTPGVTAAASPSGGIFYFDDVSGVFYHFTFGGSQKPVEIPGRQKNRDYFVSFVDGEKRFATVAQKTNTVGLLTMYDTASLQAQYSLEVPRYSGVHGPVFGEPDLYALSAYDPASSVSSLYLVKLPAGTVIRKIAEFAVSVSFVGVLPDGRVLVVDKSKGLIQAVSSDGAVKPYGQLTPPQGRTIGSVKLNHARTKFAIVYVTSYSTGLKTDIWMANIDGSDQGRVTVSDIADKAVWAPDDSQLLVYLDSTIGRGINATYVEGDCGLWSIPASARMVDNMLFRVPHPVAKELLVDGRRRCGVIAWHGN